MARRFVSVLCAGAMTLGVASVPGIAAADDDAQHMASSLAAIGVVGSQLHLAAERSGTRVGAAAVDLRLGGDRLSDVLYSRAVVFGSIGGGGAGLDGAFGAEAIYGLRGYFGRAHGPLVALEGHIDYAADDDSKRDLEGGGLLLGYQLWAPSRDGARFFEIGALGEAAASTLAMQNVTSTLGIEPAVGGRMRVKYGPFSTSARYLRVLGSQRGVSAPLDDLRLLACAGVWALSICADTSYDAGTGFGPSGPPERIASAYVGGLVSFDIIRYAFLAFEKSVEHGPKTPSAASRIPLDENSRW